ncbi:YHYH domain-containing protein [Paenibacillus sp. P26]|nr:YHYH domain-containing protein [Paenibacillus sp. P26]
MRMRAVSSMMVASLLLGSSSAVAHPGNTDANGGHYCRTNCAKWGLQQGEYHYHNSGRSSSSSTGSGTSSSSQTPAYTAPKEEIPAGYVKVQMPSFNVMVNGQQVANSASKYPVVEYKDITYFPMTWNYTQALALDTKWDSETGFVIRKIDRKAAKLNLDNGIPASRLYAKQPDFNVFVNDNWVDNSKEEYPILVLNDVTYFPMTWKYAVEELGLTIKFENNTFYISK